MKKAPFVVFLASALAFVCSLVYLIWCPLSQDQTAARAAITAVVLAVASGLTAGAMSSGKPAARGDIGDPGEYRGH